MKTFALLSAILFLLGFLGIEGLDAYLDYTDELLNAKAQHSFCEENMEALLSRGEWLCTDFQKNGGRCTYRFVPNAKRTNKLPRHTFQVGAKK